MHEYQWAEIVLGALGFLLTWTGMVIGGTWALGDIKQEVSDKIAAEALARTQALATAVIARDVELDAIRKEFGETGHALRRYIETVEKEMGTKELWNRDNFVQKNEFERAIASFEKSNESLRSDIKELIMEMKNEFKAVRQEIATRH